jgi:hypothetical protein
VDDADYYYWDHRTFVVSREDAEVKHGGDVAASVEAAVDEADEAAVAALEARTSFVDAGPKDGGMLPAPWAGGEGGLVVAHTVVGTLL